jgi:hypothetical protein
VMSRRAMMIEIAEGYEKLARRADQRNGYT